MNLSQHVCINSLQKDKKNYKHTNSLQFYHNNCRKKTIFEIIFN